MILMGAPRYVQIRIEEFDAWARKNEFAELDANTLGIRTYEKVYFKDNNEKTRIIIFSSVDLRDDAARNVGTDAIRTYIYLRTDAENNTRDWFKYIELSRVYRTKNWRDNLSSRVEEASTTISKDLCPKCNNPMVIRRGKYGPFYSCVMWSRTQCDGKGKFDE